jgi:conjugative relaxase-like TrwC/TraI family protein
MYPLLVGVTMSIHKLTAGSGYDYLTRQVAALDSTEKGHTGLASYYTERGETPGVWIGSGLGGIDGLAVGDPVTAEQMRALFGCGLHPLAELRQQQLEGPDLTPRDYQDAARLGAPFRVVDGDVGPFRLELAKRIAAIQTAAGLPAGAPLPAAERARVRTEVAREFFLAAHGREPIDARELAGQIAKDSRPRTQTVAGYDLTFSPVKSVSTLWAVAEPAVAAVIEQAHQAAVKDALAFIEMHALFTRTGPQGIRQVNVHGLVATAFTHRDSRAGDPDLHTHVAVANKVQTLDGRWLSIDGRVLFKANVAASETYNTALEQHLRDTLGVRFAERPGTDPAKRPIREIVGVDPRLNQRWSTRRAHINTRRGELAIRFQEDHGRPPTPVEALHLRPATPSTNPGPWLSIAQPVACWANDRRLRLTATDWVKNGDRWTITAASNNGGLTVTHNSSRLTLRQHNPRRPRRLRRHGARARYWAGVTPAAVHHAHPRPDRQPPLPSGRRRRRPAHPHPARNRRTPHPDRDLATDPRPRRRPHLSHHPAARTHRPSSPAVRRRPALHRRAPCRGRAAGRTPDCSDA